LGLNGSGEWSRSEHARGLRVHLAHAARPQQCLGFRTRCRGISVLRVAATPAAARSSLAGHVPRLAKLRSSCHDTNGVTGLVLSVGEQKTVHLREEPNARHSRMAGQQVPY